MASFNKVILLGNLTRDPELRQSPGGMAICKLSLAVNRSYTKGDGTPVEEVTYVDIDAFGKQAEVLARYLTKGRPLFVEGRLRLDQWEKDGKKNSRLTVVLENFQFVGGREQGGAAAEGSGSYDDSAPPPRAAGGFSRGAPQGGGGSGNYRPAPPKPASQPPADADIDDDVPF